MKTLHIDLETYSSRDLAKVGVYKYTEADDFTILLLAYHYSGNNDVHCIDLVSGESISEALLSDLTDPAVLKKAFNANFERTCLAAWLGEPMPPEQWECTMAKCAIVGLPLSLEAAGVALKLDKQKLGVGKSLITYFCKPCKPTKANGGRVRNMPADDPGKWSQFKEYCAQDVAVEVEISNRIAFYPVPATERALWVLDQKINDEGIAVDPQLIESAISIDAHCRERLMAEAVNITGLTNPNSTSQLKKWLTDEGVAAPSLSKKDIPDLLTSVADADVRRMLCIRQELSKTSVKKYQVLVNAACADGRVRGMLQYYGANRTGRWAGRLVQPHNLPKNNMECLDIARDAVSTGDIELVDMLYDNVPDVLSQLIRTAFIAAPGHRLIPIDFKAIEARVIAWLANEKWRLQVFRTHGRIYEASASEMFRIPIEKIDKKSPYRQRGKVAELALGYGGGPNALVAMGALQMGITEDELPKLVRLWRNNNRAITQLWYDVEGAAIKTVETGQPVVFRYLKFYMWKGILFIKLPSGRELAYLKPSLANNKYGSVSLTYQGVNQTNKRWETIDTYGGKLVENIVQAIARDCLAEAMLRLDRAGYHIVLHVHDEAVCEVPDTDADALERITSIMGQDVPWAPGLPLPADGFETKYYKKDD